MKKILFVCYGNICRSPMAEMIFKDLITKDNTKDILHCDSKATSREEIGNDIYYKAKATLKKHNIKITQHTATQVTISDYNEYDYIIAMEHRNIKDLLKIFKVDPKNKIRLLLANDDIEDPWYTDRFEDVYQKINKGCIDLYNYLTEEVRKDEI